MDHATKKRVRDLFEKFADTYPAPEGSRWTLEGRDVPGNPYKYRIVLVENLVTTVYPFGQSYMTARSVADLLYALWMGKGVLREVILQEHFKPIPVT